MGGPWPIRRNEECSHARRAVWTFYGVTFKVEDNRAVHAGNCDAEQQQVESFRKVAIFTCPRLNHLPPEVLAARCAEGPVLHTLLPLPGIAGVFCYLQKLCIVVSGGVPEPGCGFPDSFDCPRGQHAGVEYAGQRRSSSGAPQISNIFCNLDGLLTMFIKRGNVSCFPCSVWQGMPECSGFEVGLL
jgi:hypothetical protein